MSNKRSEEQTAITVSRRWTDKIKSRGHFTPNKNHEKSAQKWPLPFFLPLTHSRLSFVAPVGYMNVSISMWPTLNMIYPGAPGISNSTSFRDINAIGHNLFHDIEINKSQMLAKKINALRIRFSTHSITFTLFFSLFSFDPLNFSIVLCVIYYVTQNVRSSYYEIKLITLILLWLIPTSI